MGECGGKEKQVGKRIDVNQEKVNYPAVMEQVDVLTGGTDYRKYLYYQLKISIARAKGIDIIVN